MAENLLTPDAALPWMGRCDLKGVWPQSSSWVEMVSSSPHRRPGSGASRKQPGVAETRIQTHERGGAEAQHFSDSRKLSPVPPLVLQHPASAKKGTWVPERCWRATEGRQRPPVPLVLGPVPPGLLRTGLAGWLSSPWPLHVGQENLWGWGLEPTTAPLTSSGPGHWHTLRRTAQAWGLAVPG